MAECSYRKRLFFAVVIVAGVALILLVFILDTEPPVIHYVRLHNEEYSKRTFEESGEDVSTKVGFRTVHSEEARDIASPRQLELAERIINKDGEGISDRIGIDSGAVRGEDSVMDDVGIATSAIAFNDRNKEIFEDEDGEENRSSGMSDSDADLDDKESEFIRNSSRDLDKEKDLYFSSKGLEEMRNILPIKIRQSGMPKLQTDHVSADARAQSLKVVASAKVVPVGEVKQRFPKAIIAGVKKGGTRALLTFLSGHPLVRSAGREMHFFERDENYVRGIDWYLKQMPASFENEIVIEKTPGYFVSDDAIQRIHAFSKTQPEPVKLIFIFRDPVERAISDFTQSLVRSLAENTKMEIKTFKGVIVSSSLPRKISPRRSKVKIGMYAVHLRKWLRYFPREQMHFVNGDAFIKDPAPELLKLQQFLGLPPLISEKDIVYNETKGFYCIRMRKALKDWTECLGDSKGRPHPHIDPALLSKLRKFYAPYNKDFYNLTGINFNWAEQ